MLPGNICSGYKTDSSCLKKKKKEEKKERMKTDQMLALQYRQFMLGELKKSVFFASGIC